MELQLIRDTYTEHTTTGKLYINGEFFCHTLEDTVRGSHIKVKGWTAIPKGCYDVGIRYSPGFKREMPVIFNQEDKETIIKDGISFKYVMFHGGNRHTNTEGCPLVAYNRLDDNTIQGTAEKELTALVKEALQNGEEVRVEIINKAQPE